MWTRSTTRAAGRIAARHGREFARHVVPAVVKPARTLWNEVIGFLFLCIGVTFGFKTGRLWLDYSKAAPAEEFSGLVRVVLAGGCTLMMLGFGISSFVRARRISRS